MKKYSYYIAIATICIECLFAINLSAKGGGSTMTVTTTYTSEHITQTSATAGGNVSTGGGTVSSRGVCYSTSTNPTTSNSNVTAGTGTGSFTCSLTDLAASTTYYIRAYAITRSGTTYGNQITFTTLAYPTYGTVTDIDGNTYTTVVIGTQEWMMENLRTTRYQNGDNVQLVTDNTTWYNLTTGAYCSYNNDDNNVADYGRLYNWYACTDSRNLAPSGWRVPSNADWNAMESYLGGNLSGGEVPYIGKKLKESGYTHWSSDNTGNNVSGFSAVGGGQRLASGGFANMYAQAWFWSTSENGTLKWYRYLQSNVDLISANSNDPRRGFSVRCVKNSTSSSPKIGVSDEPAKENQGFLLEQNYPNPFNDMTNINYTLPQECLVNLSIYDVYGTMVAELENGYKPAGNYNIIFDGNLFSSGTYFYRLMVNGKILTGSMKIIK